MDPVESFLENFNNFVTDHVWLALLLFFIICGLALWWVFTGEYKSGSKVVGTPLTTRPETRNRIIWTVVGLAVGTLLISLFFH